MRGILESNQNTKNRKTFLGEARLIRKIKHSFVAAATVVKDLGGPLDTLVLVWRTLLHKGPKYVWRQSIVISKSRRLQVPSVTSNNELTIIFANEFSLDNESVIDAAEFRVEIRDSDGKPLIQETELNVFGEYRRRIVVKFDQNIVSKISQDYFFSEWLEKIKSQAPAEISFLGTALVRKYSRLYIGQPLMEIVPQSDGTSTQNLSYPIEISIEGENNANRPGGWLISEKVENLSPHFENQIDFRNLKSAGKPRVLAYYLPQFHEIPENNAWHGNGFTEWVSVKKGQKLWPNHYQQRLPHLELGEYKLTDDSVLLKQAQIMKKARVDGLVFYHYWFNGKLILEKPSQLLLNNKDIDIPFAFCWANENWTRSWDGNNHDVLLAQNYGRQDAIDFIKYLIPFFKDKRYLTHEGRPVLMVYRANLIPDIKDYVEEWNHACVEAGLNRPYLVSTLTRDVDFAESYGFDANLERVLFDWTDDKVKSVTHLLKPFTKFIGKTLDYFEVANYYQLQELKNSRPTWRSLVPDWDNTARYKNRAHALVNSTPAMFQTWLETLQEQASKLQIPFTVINAWNEWAEGAHLEPDARTGYAYLNAVGRVQARGSNFLEEKAMVVRLEFPDLTNYGGEQLKQWKKTAACLEAAIKFSGIKIAKDEEISDGVLSVTSPCIFGRTLVSDLMEKSLVSGAEVASSVRTISDTTFDFYKGFKIKGPVSFRPNENQLEKSIILSKAQTFIFTPNSLEPAVDVTCLIRVHGGTVPQDLENAILSVENQDAVEANILVCIQKAKGDDSNELDAVLTWAKNRLGTRVEVKSFFASDETDDLRSEMLLGGIKSIATKYAIVLDSDDQLFPFALNFLRTRLIQSGKVAAFGRIFKSIIRSGDNEIWSRTREYANGRSFQDFLNQNISPIHGFMLDLTKIELEGIRLDKNHKYMEDYALTLQIFGPDNVDWDSLSLEFYIGDYSHFTDRTNTLAFTDSQEKNRVLQDAEYWQCESIISRLQVEAKAKRRKTSNKVK